MKVPHLAALLSAPLGLYPLRNSDATVRVRVNEGTCVETQTRDGVQTKTPVTSRIYTLYDKSLFYVQAWLTLRKEADGYVFDSAMRLCEGVARVIPQEINHKRMPMDFVDEEAIALLVAEILLHVVVIDDDVAKAAAQQAPRGVLAEVSVPWRFAQPQTEAKPSPLKVSRFVKRGDAPGGVPVMPVRVYADIDP
jgi:hypothetical protein